jgi:Lon protease-like protein
MKPGKLASETWIIGLLLFVLAAQPSVSGQAVPDTLPAVIPIFPLEDAMLFPAVSRPFHIFEPRYRAMIADALKGDRIIGMVTLRPGFEANYEGRPPIYPVGCAGVIVDVEELPDGRFNIVLRGLVKFRVTAEDPGRSYRLARVSAVAEPTIDAEKNTLHEQRQRLELLMTRAGSDAKVPPEIADEEVVNALAQYVPLEPEERQALLELDGALSRAKALIGLLESMSQPR